MSAPAATLRPDAAGDEAARALACREYARPLVLEAGAGTGKTATLVARIVTWCVGPGWQRAAAEERAHAGAEHAGADPGVPAALEAVAARVLRGVVAITFTEKAAAEMADRVGQALVALHAGERVPGLRVDASLADAAPQRAALLLTQIEHLTTCTIHAFCQRLLAAHPLEAGLHPGFRIDADFQAARRIAVRTVSEWVRAGDPDMVALLSHQKGPDAIAATLFALLKDGVPAAALARDPYGDDDVVPLAHELARELAALTGAIAAPLRAGRAHLLKTALVVLAQGERLAAALPGAARTADVVTALGDGDLDKARERLAQWAKAKLSGSERAAFEGIEDLVVTKSRAALGLLDALRGMQPDVLRPAFAVLGKLLARARDRMRREGFVSFQDALEKAAALLEDAPDVRHAIQSDVDQLLVDEFQDTDPVQYRLVGALALEDGARCPGLFLVGDPKQSIYGWRNADLGAYEAFKETLVARGGRVASLVVNYRSTPPILEEVTRLLGEVMLEDPGVQPAFVPLVAHRGDEPDLGGRASVEHWIAWPVERGAAGELVARPDVGNEDACALEARAIARDVRAQHDADGVAWNAFCVLLRSTSQQDTYVDALKRAGIPFVVERDKRYFLRREVLDAICLVRTVVDPLDHVALVGWLRNPCVGVPDAALLPLWRQWLPDLLARLRRPDADAYAALDAAIEAAAAEVDALRARSAELDETLARIEGWPLVLRVALRALAEMRASWADDPADVCLGKLRVLLRAEETEAARYLGAHRLAHLERFFAGILTDRRAGLSGEALASKLCLVIRESDEYDDEPPGDDTLDAVRVMTIHKAKGLDFERVYVANLHAGTRGGAGDDDRWLRHGGAWHWRLFGATSLGFARAAAHAARVERAETARLAYVATTRAKDRLVTAGRWSDAPAHEPLLAALLGRAPFPIPPWRARKGEARPAVALADFAALTADDPACWRVLGVDDAAADVDDAASRDEVRDLEALCEDSGRLLARRAGLAAWHARRLLAPVSALAASSHAAPAGAQLELAFDGARLPGAGAPRPPARHASDVARFVGTAIHRALELWRWDRPLADEHASASARVDAWLAATVAPGRLVAARARARALLDGLVASPLAEVLRREDEGELGREVPVLMAGELAGCDEAAVVVGSIDRLVRDPDGRLAVVDHKTDRAPDEAAAAALGARHREQGRLYVRAVQAALGEPAPPRFRLHALDAGRSESLELGDA